MDRRTVLKLLSLGGISLAAQDVVSAADSAPDSQGAAAAMPSCLRIHAGDIKLPGRGATLQAHVSRPSAACRFPAVIVPAMGLDGRARAFARRMASAGYVALVLDLLSRQGNEASPVIQSEQASDIHAALCYLSAHRAVARDNIRVLTLPDACR
jgi:hypothetical protein